MGELILKKEYVDKIRKTPELFGKIFGDEPGGLDTTVSYGLQLLNNNDPKLTQAGVLRILRLCLGIDNDNQLLEEIQDPLLKSA